MPEYVTVAQANEIAPGQGLGVEVNGRRVAVFNVDGRYMACDDACPHVGFSLAEGDLDDRSVICFGHGWAFNLETGSCDTMPVEVDVFPVEVVDGQVRVAVG